MTWQLSKKKSFLNSEKKASLTAVLPPTFPLKSPEVCVREMNDYIQISDWIPMISHLESRGHVKNMLQ